MPDHAHAHSGTTIAVEQAHRDINLEAMRTYVELGEGCYWTVSALAWSRSGRYCASAGADDTLRIWDMEVKHQIRRYLWRHELGAVCDLVWSPDDRFIGLLAESPLGTHDAHGARIVVLDALRGEEVFRRNAATDPALKVMELAWTEPASLEQAAAPVSPADIAAYPRDPARSWSADGRYVVVNSHENWQSVAGAPQALGSHVLGLPMDAAANASHDGAVRDARAADGARNGHRITLGTARVVEAGARQPPGGRGVLSFPDGTSWVAWAPIGSWIAGVHGRSVTVWDAATAMAQCEYRGHAGLFTHVTCLAWAPSGEYVATGDSSGVIHVWQVWRGEA